MKRSNQGRGWDRWISGRKCRRPCGEIAHGSLKEMNTGQSEGTVGRGEAIGRDRGPDLP